MRQPIDEKFLGFQARLGDLVVAWVLFPGKWRDFRHLRKRPEFRFGMWTPKQQYYAPSSVGWDSKAWNDEKFRSNLHCLGHFVRT